MGRCLGCCFFGNAYQSLKLTAKAPENGWLEDYFPFAEGFLSGAMLVLGSVSSAISELFLKWYTLTNMNQVRLFSLTELFA